MKPLARLIGLAALAATIVPPTLFMLKLMPLGTMQAIMLGATAAWFGAAPFWMKVE